MKLYISDLSIIVLIVFYLPIVIWVMRRIWRSNLQGLAKPLAIFAALVVAYLIPLGDVTYNSIAMAKVCPTAGLHIYKTVEVEGVAGVAGDALKKYPYDYVEVMRPGGQWVHYERQGDAIIRTLTYSPKAEYELMSDVWHPDLKKRVVVMRDTLQQRITGEILAEHIKYHALPSMIDQLFVYSWAGSGHLGSCGGDKFLYEILPQILIPKHQLEKIIDGN